MSLDEKLGIGTPTPEVRTGVVEILKQSIKEFEEDLLKWIFVADGLIKRREDFDAIFKKHFGEGLI